MSLKCDFRERTSHDATHLIRAANFAAICEECVGVCAQILRERKKEKDE